MSMEDTYMHSFYSPTLKFKGRGAFRFVHMSVRKTEMEKWGHLCLMDTFLVMCYSLRPAASEQYYFPLACGSTSRVVECLHLYPTVQLYLDHCLYHSVCIFYKDFQKKTCVSNLYHQKIMCRACI